MLDPATRHDAVDIVVEGLLRLLAARSHPNFSSRGGPTPSQYRVVPSMSTPTLLDDLFENTDYTDVLGPTEALEDAPPRWLTTIQAAAVLGVHRRTLDILAHRHLDVHGGPVVVAGRKRLHLRWPAEGLDRWLVEVRKLDEPKAKPFGGSPRPRRPEPHRADESTPTDWKSVRKRLLTKSS